MKEIRFELLTPNQLMKEMEETGIVFLPVGSMEWHGPHMGMGMDTCNAYAVSLRTAEHTGGIVFPPLYIGTETKRSQDILKKLGFCGNETVVGMDFPQNSLQSMYWPPYLFEEIMKYQIKMLCEMGFRKIIVMNGHGADEQKRVLEKIAEEYSQKYNKKIRVILTLFQECGYGIGHAGLVETSIMAYLYPQAVDLSLLPEKPVKLRNIDYGIADSETFEQGPNEDFTVRYDPRDATKEIGEKILAFAVEKCVEIVKSLE